MGVNRNLPLAYCPDKYDDWGTIRFAPDEIGRQWHALKVSLPTRDEAVLSKHRVNGTDPCEEFGRFIVTAVNNHAALVMALQRLQHNFNLLLAGKPVRDVAETEAEVRAALSAASASETGKEG